MSIRDRLRRLQLRRAGKEQAEEIKEVTNLVAEAEIICSSRNTDLDTILMVFLRSFVYSHSRRRILNLGDKMPFGKYQGETLQNIIHTDPGYMDWIVGNTDIRVSTAVIMAVGDTHTEEEG